MLNMNNKEDYQKMMNYYRTTDMLNLLYFFPNLSPIRNITIVENEQDYLNNKMYLESFEQNRVDTIKGRVPISGIENSGGNNTFYDTLVKVKEKSKDNLVYYIQYAYARTNSLLKNFKTKEHSLYLHCIKATSHMWLLST